MGDSVPLMSSHLLIIPSIFSVLVLLPSAPAPFPLTHFFGLFGLVDAFLVDAKSHAAYEGQDHNHNGSYSPHRHWGGKAKERCGFTSSMSVLLKTTSKTPSSNKPWPCFQHLCKTGMFFSFSDLHLSEKCIHWNFLCTWTETHRRGYRLVGSEPSPAQMFNINLNMWLSWRLRVCGVSIWNEKKETHVYVKLCKRIVGAGAKWINLK